MGMEHGGVLSCLLVALLFIGYFLFTRGCMVFHESVS